MILNQSIRAIIVDDEIDAIEILIDLIKESGHNINIVGTANSAKAGLLLLEKEKPDLLFLDVQMPGGTGFDLLSGADEKSFHTVFTSAHESYAIEAIKFHAMAYLLKPISLEDLTEAIIMVTEERIHKLTADYRALLQNIGLGGSKRIAIPTGSGHRYFEPREIIRVEASKNYSNVYVEGESKPLLVSKNLKQFEKLLSKFGFLRMHNAHLVNPQHVKEFIRKDGGSILLSDGLNLIIGPSYRQMVMDFLNNNSEGI